MLNNYLLNAKVVCVCMCVCTVCVSNAHSAESRKKIALVKCHIAQLLKIKKIYFS